MRPHGYRFYSFAKTCNKSITPKKIFGLFKNPIYIIKEVLSIHLKSMSLLVQIIITSITNNIF